MDGKLSIALVFLDFNGSGRETENIAKTSLGCWSVVLMKPLQIGLLVAVGALGGALVMRLQSSGHSDREYQMAPVPAPVAHASTPADPPAPEPQPRAESQAPSPFPEKNKDAQRAVAPAPKARADAKPHPDRSIVAQVQVAPKTVAAAPAPVAAPASAPTPSPETSAPPVRSAPAPVPVLEPVREPATPAPPPPPAEPNHVTIASGTLIPVRLLDGLSSERNMQGDSFSATLDAPLIAGEFAIAERGARVEGKVVSSAKAGKVQGVSKLEIELTGITTSDGQHVRIATHSFTKTGPTSHGEDAAKVGAGAGIGAIIGAIAGGGKGAGVGAAVGGAAGAGDVMLTRGKPATLATETRINFRLSAPVTITERQ
jgi:hypothetical protein